MSRLKADSDLPKYKQLAEKLSQDILAGKYEAGHKLPSEAALVRRYGTSRITVGHAMRELKQRGLIARIAGSGTYVTKPPLGGMLFGLIIPDLGDTEIFGPICQGLAAAPEAEAEAGDHALLWGHSDRTAATKQEQALQLCRQFIERRVAGVFFAPLELAAGKDETNLSIAESLDAAGIPLVLLDRCYMPFPGRSHHDLVGIDNRRAGHLAARHLVDIGCRRIAFLSIAGAAATVDARAAGYREALIAAELPLEAELQPRPDAVDEASIRQVMSAAHPDGFVCANDRIAGQLMQALMTLGFHIPRDVRIVGIDDVKYANLLPVPLTSIHQPCREIGEAAMAAMLQRIARPEMATRDILLACSLVVRAS
jgi:GntR family transcriptional regulator of arabinose operon